jgi:hypothetical protein
MGETRPDLRAQRTITASIARAEDDYTRARSSKNIELLEAH